MPNRFQVPDNYYQTLARIESANQPYARARTSTASGLYQFTRGTWEDFGGSWGGQSGVAFGGLRPTVSQQQSMVERLTARNGGYLAQRDIPINSATLYAAHFLGPGGAGRILGVDRNTPIESVTSADQRRANPSILRGTAGNFFDWLERKTGADPFGMGSRAPFQANPANSVESNITGLPMENGDFFGSQGILDRWTWMPGEDILEPAKEAGSNLVRDAIEALSDPAKRIGYVVIGTILLGGSIFVIMKGPQTIVAAGEAYLTKGTSLAKNAAMSAVA